MQVLSGKFGPVGGKAELAHGEKLLHRETVTVLRTVVRLPAAVLPVVAEYFADYVIFLQAADATLESCRSKSIIFSSIWIICIFRHSAHRACEHSILHVRLRIAHETGILSARLAEHSDAVLRGPQESRHAIAIHCRVNAGAGLGPAVVNDGRYERISANNFILGNVGAGGHHGSCNDGEQRQGCPIECFSSHDQVVSGVMVIQLPRSLQQPRSLSTRRWSPPGSGLNSRHPSCRILSGSSYILYSRWYLYRSRPRP